MKNHCCPVHDESKPPKAVVGYYWLDMGVQAGVPIHSSHLIMLAADDLMKRPTNLVDCTMMAEKSHVSSSKSPHTPLSSLALKRMRHRCIAISPIRNNENPASGPTMSELTIDIPLSKARSLSCSHPQNTELTASTDTNPSHTTPRRRSKTGLSLQRSLSLHEFSEDALPIIMYDTNLSESPPHIITPQPKSPKPNSFLTRRSSFINGQVFKSDDFIIGEVLGCGFFGQCVKVTHRNTGQPMVMKELICCDEEGKKTFLQEAAVLRGLNHPKLLHYIGFLYKSKNLHIITEYIPGGTLENLLHSTSDVLPITRQIKIGLDIAEAMQYLHSQQVIHRDLNSPNCLLREDESVVVSDFGLSRLLLESKSAIAAANKLAEKDSTRQLRIPRTPRIRKKRYTVVGNPYWMAPEMIKGETYDEKVDIYSFGVILCEVIGKVRADPDYMPRLQNFAVDQVTFLDQYSKGCPIEFTRIAFQCCQLTGDDRPSFEDIHTQLVELFRNYSAIEQRKASKLLVRTSSSSLPQTDIQFTQ